MKGMQRHLWSWDCDIIQGIVWNRIMGKHFAFFGERMRLGMLLPNIILVSCTATLLVEHA